MSVENENHCDFVKLREMLIRTNMEDLRETTHFKHYELYRRNKLKQMGFSDDEMMRWVCEWVGGWVPALSLDALMFRVLVCM